MKVCPSCRWHNQPESETCASCRGPLDQAWQIDEPSAPPSNADPTSRPKWHLSGIAPRAAVLVGMLLLSALAFQLLQVLPSAPSGARSPLSGVDAGPGLSGLMVANDEHAHVREYSTENFTVWMFAGQYGAGTFQLKRETVVGYTFEVISKAGRLDACIFRAEDWTRFQRNETYQGWACHKGARAMDDSVKLPAGNYQLGTLCLHEAACTIRESVWRVTAVEDPTWKTAPRPRAYYAENAPADLVAGGRHLFNLTLDQWSLLHYEVVTEPRSGAVVCIMEEKDRQPFLNGSFVGRMCSRNSATHAGAHFSGGEWSLGIHCWSSTTCPNILYTVWSEPARATPYP